MNALLSLSLSFGVCGLIRVGRVGFTGYTITDIRPDYVVVGETKNYNIDRMEKAINLVRYRRRATPT